MSTMPSPEAFLAQPSTEEDEDDQDFPVDQQALDVRELLPPGSFEPSPFDWPNGPLESIAASLRQIVARQPAPTVCTRCVELTDEVQSYREAADDLAYKHQTVVELVEEIEATIKKSTSKLANDVRAAIGRWREPVLPEPADHDQVLTVQPDVPPYLRDMPADDADVETWRAYARHAVGAGEGSDIDSMNRSQIRSMLGIPHPGAPAGEQS